MEKKCVHNWLIHVLFFVFSFRCQASTVAVSFVIATMLQGKYKDKNGKFRVNDIIQDAYEYASTCLETDKEKKDLMFYLKCDNIKV